MNAQSLQFEKKFREQGIRFRLVGTVRFYSREEVKDALAYLSLLTNRNDEVSFRSVVNRPGRGIGAASVEKILEEWRAEAAGGSWRGPPCRRTPRPRAPGRRARPGSRTFSRASMSSPRALRMLPLAELARTLLSRTGLYEMYRTRDRSEDTAKSANLEEMVSDMAGYGAGPAALTQFLESVALASPLDAAEPTRRRP